jgi:hypothetical protein
MPYGPQGGKVKGIAAEIGAGPAGPFVYLFDKNMNRIERAQVLIWLANTAQARLISVFGIDYADKEKATEVALSERAAVTGQ